jgi:hypothetical protein
MPDATNRIRIIAVENPTGFGLARMFQILGEETRPKLQVVRTLNDALVALGAQSPHFEPLEWSSVDVDRGITLSMLPQGYGLKRWWRIPVATGPFSRDIRSPQRSLLILSARLPLRDVQTPGHASSLAGHFSPIEIARTFIWSEQ